MRRADSLEKSLMLGKIEGGRRRGQQRMKWLDGITSSMDMSWVNSGSWWWTGRPGVLWLMGSQRVRHYWVTELNWTRPTWTSPDGQNQNLHMDITKWSIPKSDWLYSLQPHDRSTPGLPVHHQLPESTQTHVHRVGDAIQTSHPLSSPSPPAPNPSQNQGLFQWVNSSHEVAKVLEFQL